MPTPLSSTTLSSFSFDSGIDPAVLYIADTNYWTATRRWIVGKFAPAWDEFAAPLLIKWQSEFSDCDDWAGLGAVFARIKHARTMRAMIADGRLRDPGEIPALAVGEFWYQVGGDPDKGHAIMRWVAREKGEWVNVFFEPQPPSHVVGLTRQEVESCGLSRM